MHSLSQLLQLVAGPASSNHAPHCLLCLLDEDRTVFIAASQALAVFNLEDKTSTILEYKRTLTVSW